MFRKLAILTAVVAAPILSLFAPVGAHAASLKVGDLAPKLPPVTWLHGEPVKEWEAGKIYVLDFWATWCRPCIAAMPHMNEVALKQREKGVYVVGLAIWPNERSKPTKLWIDERATDNEKANDNIDYTIGEDIDGKVAQAYMTAAGRNGIPTVMIINREGKLAWMGHPMVGMDEALAQIIDGSYDLSKEAEKAKRQAEIDAQSQKLMMEFQTAQMASDWPKLLEVTDKMLALDAEQFGQAGIFKYFITLTKVEDREKAAVIGKELIEGPFATRAPLLNGLAYTIVNNEDIKDDYRDLDLALASATKANEIEEGKRAEVLDTLARIYFLRKDTAKAIELQTKALEVVDDDELKASLEKTLEEYKRAANPE